MAADLVCVSDSEECGQGHSPSLMSSPVAVTPVNLDEDQMKCGIGNHSKHSRYTRLRMR